MNIEKLYPLIALIGQYPPPYGGVAIHIKRLGQCLEKQGFPYNIYCFWTEEQSEGKIIRRKGWKLWLLYYFFSVKEQILHLHNYIPYMMIGLSVIAIFRKRILVVTFHSFRYTTSDINLIDRFAFWIAKKANACFIVVSFEVKEKIMAMGVGVESINVIPAYIQPAVISEEVKEILGETRDFINEHYPVITANASFLRYHNGNDLYGIDMCIDLCAYLKTYFPRVGVLLCLSEVGDISYYGELNQMVLDKGIASSFLFQTAQCQYYPILMNSNIFVRPTNSDGDAISVREALFFKVPVVASNAVARPEGVVLFESRNMDNFRLKVKSVLDNYEQYKEALDEVEVVDYADEIITIYKNQACKL